MREVIANAPTACDKARPGLSKEESARFFGPPPLIVGEDQAQYAAMRVQISAAVGPLDFLEEIWVNDVVSLVWEALRLRRLRANLLKADAARGLGRILSPIVSTESSRNLARNWVAREPDAVAKGDAALAAAGLTIDAVMAQTLAVNIRQIESIDRMVAGAEARRNVALREQFKLASSIVGKRIKVPLSDAPGRALCPASLKGPEKLAAILAEFARELAALDRYERRALSRRKFAIRAFDLARLEAERRAGDARATSFGGVGKPIEAGHPFVRGGATLSTQQP